MNNFKLSEIIKDVRYDSTPEVIQCTLLLKDGSEFSSVMESWRSGKLPEEEGFDQALREKVFRQTVERLNSSLLNSNS